MTVSSAWHLAAIAFTNGAARRHRSEKSTGKRILRKAGIALLLHKTAADLFVRTPVACRIEIPLDACP
jgi:hypothetical protein